MTLGRGYALGPGEALEDLQMGDGSVLSLKVTGRQSTGLVTVIEGVALAGGIEDYFRAQRDYMASLASGQPFGPDAFARIPGHETRPVVGPPLA